MASGSATTSETASVDTHPPARRETARPAPCQLPWTLRCSILAGGLLVAGLLGTARMLEPNPSGSGTHLQLGLPPCTSVLMFGAPCPSCGMTTSWAWATRGAWGRAAEANLGGLMLAGIALAFVPMSCYLFLAGRTSRSGWISLTFGIALLCGLLAALLQWLTRLPW